MEIDRPRAAVIIIAYNDETHIERSIQSACNQTERNIEIICVDDGSTDSTYENMCRCANRDERIRVISQTNAGALGARYAGLQQVTCDYVQFLDSDDTLMPEAVETACDAADETGADVLEFGVSLVKDESNPPTQEAWTFLERYFSQNKPLPETDHGPELLKSCFVEHNITWNTWNKIYRTELLRKAFRFYEGEWVSMEEDMLLNLMVMCQTERYARIPQKLYAYTVGGGISTTAEKLTSADAIKKAASEVIALKLAREWINKLGATQNEVMSGVEAMTEFVRNGILNHILRRVAAEQRSEYLNLLSQYCERNEFFDLISDAISQQQAHVIQLEEQTASLVESLKQEQSRIAQLEEQNARLGESLKQQQPHIAQLEERNLQLRKDFDTISNARLWKMTAPIRKVLDTVKMVKKGRADSSIQDTGECGDQEAYNARVSVIVPVWNGGEDLKRLLKALRAQLGITSIETIIVDSGSSDRSVEYSEEAGAKVISIPHAEFSHSYARNLGAQHASGEYLLFMTQDACPSGPYWLRGMLRPVLKQGVVAVSCREEPRPDCDLLGRVNVLNHSNYMGILSDDRIMQMPDEVNVDSLRKNAQLNDVACLIRKDVFDKYRYRRNYAEDLDLGLRLIRDGHRLALLSSVHVIHSHTRPPMYHFKRGIVDVSTVNEILPGLIGGSCPEQCTINRILTAYCVMKLYVQEARQYKLAGDGRNEWDCFREWTVREIDYDIANVERMKAEERKALIESDGVYFDTDYRKVILEILNILKGDFFVEPTMVNDIKRWLVNVLGSYFAYAKEPFSDSVVDEICILAEKLTGLFAGNLIGTIFEPDKNENSELNRLAKRYAQGI